MNRSIIISLVLIILQVCANSWGDCIGPSSSRISFEVLSCEEVTQKQLENIKWPGYEGAILEIKMMSKEKTKMKADQLAIREKVFFNTKEKSICSVLRPHTKRKAILDWACCDGDPNPPCFLGFSCYIHDLTK
jgi:hypothetical protein